MANGSTAQELRELKPAGAESAAPPRDVRAPRPLILGTLLRLDTLRRALRVLTLVLLDIWGLGLALWTALGIKAAIQNHDIEVVRAQVEEAAPIATLVMLLLFARSGLYRDRPLRPGSSKVISSLFQVAIVTLVYAEIEGRDFTSYYIFYGSLFFALLYVSSFRYLFEKASGALLRAAGYRRRAVLVGEGPQIEAVAEALSSSHAIEPFGYVSLTPHRSKSLHDFGSLDTLGRHFDAIDEVLIADPDFPQDEAVELVERCHNHNVRVRVAPSTMEILMDRGIEFVPGQSLPLFELKPPVFEGLDFALKRTFDLIGATLLLLVLSPALALIALAVKTSSRGPVFYRSLRPGIGGTPFSCIKFRTMYDGADQIQESLEGRNEKAGAIFKIRADPRITRVGAFLRRWSLDELPQLFNVIRGDMSLVGPRPLPQRDYERLEEWHRKRYLVLPGMTGLWQVSGRAELDFDDLVRLDFLYLERWSVFLDLSILIKTVPAVLRARGAW